MIGQVGSAASELLEVRSRIQEGANQARVGRAAAEYLAARRRSVFEADSDTDLDTLEVRFDKQGTELLEQSRKALPPDLQTAFEDRVYAHEAAARLDVAQSVTRRRTVNARADADEAVRIATDEASRASSSAQRGQILGQADAMLQGLVETGILDHDQYDDRRRKMLKGVADADLLVALEADPAGAFRELGDPASQLAAGRTEVERLQARKDAKTAFEHQLSERRANASFAQTQVDRAEKDADDAADQKALDLLSGGDLPGLQQHLTATRGVLSRDRRQFYLDRIASGGGLSDAGSKTNPGAYVDLSNRAAAGQLERSEIDESFRGGLISKADRDKLVEAAGDRRFNSAEKLLSDSLQQSPFRFDTKTQVRNAEAKRAFTEFRAANPKASETEALTYARELIRYSGLQDLANALPPRFGAPAAGAPFDAGAATAAAMAARESGQIDDAQLDEELQRIETMEDAQKRAGAAK